MKDFAALFTAIDQTTKTSIKTKLLEAYLKSSSEEDRLWCTALFTGRRPKRAVTTTQLREWASERAGVPNWLFEDSYSVVGDLAETIALVLPPESQNSDEDLSYWIKYLSDLHDVDIPERRTRIEAAWDRLDATQRFLFNKLLTGGFRIGVSQKLMTRALAYVTGQTDAEMAHRLMGNWSPETHTWSDLIESDTGADLSKPYPFYLAYQLDQPPQNLGQPSEWRAEWKWDGIRGQVILREGQHFVWSRGEELMTDRFPELARLTDFLPGGTVLDGEILAWHGEAPLPFNTLQARIGRKSVPKKLLAEAPVILAAYDLLEHGGKDLRETPFAERRACLETLLADMPVDAPIRLPDQLKFDTWDDLAAIRSTARENHAEGLMLKRAASPYQAGRKKGDWWKWKLDPLTIDAVMIYAQAGHGRRAGLFTDYTFAVRKGNELVPFTKAYSGLTDAEFRDITAWVKKNTLQRFGPVRQVTPHHVFEIAFEGIHASPRHKSGVALRFPRMSRWRKDKPMDEANTYDDLLEMLETYG